MPVLVPVTTAISTTFESPGMFILLTLVSLLIGGVGGIGAIAIGRLCDRLSVDSQKWRPWTIAICSAVALPFAWMFLQADSLMAAYAWNVVPSFVGLIYASIAYTAAQELVGHL